MEIEHLIDILNKPTDRGHLAYAHTARVSTNYQHWQKKQYKANQANLPTLRVLSYVQNIEGAELEHIPNLQAPNKIALSIRTASKKVDGIRAKQRGKYTAKRVHQAITATLPSPQLLRQVAETPGPSLGGGSLRLDTNPRETNNIGRTQ
jgi:hypothetical protein